MAQNEKHDGLHLYPILFIFYLILHFILLCFFSYIPVCFLGTYFLKHGCVLHFQSALVMSNVKGIIVLVGCWQLVSSDARDDAQTD